MTSYSLGSLSLLLGLLDDGVNGELKKVTVAEYISGFDEVTPKVTKLSLVAVRTPLVFCHPHC